LEIESVNPCLAIARRVLLASVTAGAVVLTACSSIENTLAGDKIDYRSAATKTSQLEVPPDLTQLSRDARYQPQAATVSASTFGQATPTPTPTPTATGTGTPATTATAAAVATPTVALQAVGEMRIMRDGNVRWLFVPMSPEQLWPQFRAFWIERGFTIAAEDPKVGTLETDWAENRAKLPQDGVRKLIGRVFDGFFSTNEKDQFRARVERVAGGSEIYIVHRGAEEVYATKESDITRWEPRARDPQLEAELLSRLMIKLGAREESARAAAAAPVPVVATANAKARIVADSDAATLQVDEGFDRAWRRVGLALDRSGFTVEDRDRAGGLYFVRYVDPADVGKEEPGMFSRLFGSTQSGPTGPMRYRIAVKRAGDDRSTVSVLDAQGGPEAGPNGQRIVALLLEDLK